MNGFRKNCWDLKEINTSMNAINRDIDRLTNRIQTMLDKYLD